MTRCCIGVLITRVLGCLVAPLAAAAPLPPKGPPVGFLDVPAPLSLRDAEAFRHGLHACGDVARQNIAHEERSTSA
jgi:hypothetical protein